jgi:hypothetical protein
MQQWEKTDMVIEMNGLPGSGKSYFVERAVAALKENEICAENMAVTEKKMIWMVVQKIQSVLLLHRACKDKELLRLREKYRNRKARYAVTISFDSYLKRLLYLTEYYKYLQSKQKRYLFDEGIYQVMTAMAVDFDMESKELLYLWKRIKENDRDVISIWYHIEIETCMDSLKKRNRQVCDIDRLKEEKLREMLKKYEAVFQFFETYGCEFLHMNRKDCTEGKIRSLIERTEL